MRILFVVHETNSPFSVFPFGVSYMAGVLTRRGHQVEVFDQAITHASDDAVVNYILNNDDIDCVGLGFQAAYYRIAKKTSAALVSVCKNRDIPFVLGGSAPSASPAYFLRSFGADYVMVGECDETIVKFAAMIDGDLSPSLVPGLCWNDEGHVRLNPRVEAPADLDALPAPAYELFDMKAYTYPRRIPGVHGLARPMGVLTTRGCPYACKFCFRLEKSYRLRSVGDCIDEIRHLIDEYGINYVGFQDDLFMASKARTIEFCDAILREGLKFSWICNGRFNIADSEQLLMMKRAGCVTVAYGLESGDQKILDEMDKRITVDQIIEVASLTREAGLICQVPAMCGLPGETRESVDMTVDVIMKSTSWHDRRTLRPMQPYPGSPYFTYCVDNGYLDGEDDFYSRYISSEKWTVNLTDMSDDEFDDALYHANEKLLRAHYDHAFAADLETFKQIYFKGDVSSFIPMR